MAIFLRWLIILVSFFSLGYSIFKFIESPSNLYYIIGGVSAVLGAVTSYVEFKSKKTPAGISSGDDSVIVNVTGNKNKTSVKK